MFVQHADQKFCLLVKPTSLQAGVVQKGLTVY